MSVLIRGNNVSFIDHRKFINELYNTVSENENITSTFKLSQVLFHIKNVSKNESSRKRSHESDALHAETLVIKQIYKEFVDKIPSTFKEEINNKHLESTTSDVRDMAHRLFESTMFDHAGINGGNTSYNSLKCKIKDEYFIIPPISRFFCGCVKEQCRKLSGNKFDILIADPPWWNKFIRRLKNANEKLSYSMMYNEDIASIPVKDLLSDNCLVAVWCTNAPSHIDAVKNIILPEWGVTYLTTWYWLKVTVDLEPICPFSTGNRKQPYERLIMGRVGDNVTVPETQVIMSVPSALHSHKPPLLDLLSPYIKVEYPQALELFARYLLPNTTSVGYEPLKWQHISLYQQDACDNKNS